MSLCNQLDVEQFGQVDFSNEPEAAVTAYIAAAEGLIKGWTAVDLINDDPSGDITETLNGEQRRILHLGRIPIITINTVVEDDVTLVAGTDYLQEDEGGTLMRIRGGNKGTLHRWTRNLQAIVVTYTGGFEPATDARVVGEAPMDLRFACAQIAGRIYRAAAAWAATPLGAGALKSIELPDVGSATFEQAVDVGLKQVDSQGLLPDEKRALSPYRRREYAR